MTNLDKLKAQADELGIRYHHRAGEKTIQAAIDAYLALQREGEEETAKEETKTGRITPLTSEEFRKRALPERLKNLNRLIRCQITCMNPMKKEWAGEIISVGSAKHGTYKKFIPFDGREYHIPQIIFDMLKERKCTIFHTVTDARGQKIRKGRLIDEFSINVLPSLTAKELAELRRQQAMANNIAA